jgi:hypothetical protein
MWCLMRIKMAILKCVEKQNIYVAVNSYTRYHTLKQY